MAVWNMRDSQKKSRAPPVYAKDAKAYFTLLLKAYDGSAESNLSTPRGATATIDNYVATLHM